MAARTSRISRRVRVGIASVITSAALLGGCADGVEINSPLLNSLGVATGALGQKEEPRLAPRAPLVMPPSSQRLPEPGQPAAAAAAGPAANPAWPKDKDYDRVATAAEKKRQHAQHCRDGNWKERAMDDGPGAKQGPEGSCNTFIDWAGGLFGNGPAAPAGDAP
jgi:hypothetical protein